MKKTKVKKLLGIKKKSKPGKYKAIAVKSWTQKRGGIVVNPQYEYSVYYVGEGHRIPVCHVLNYPESRDIAKGIAKSLNQTKILLPLDIQ